MHKIKLKSSTLVIKMTALPHPFFLNEYNKIKVYINLTEAKQLISNPNLTIQKRIF